MNSKIGEVVGVCGAVVDFDDVTDGALVSIAARLGGVVDWDAREVEVAFDQVFNMPTNNLAEVGDDYMIHVLYPACSQLACVLGGFRLTFKSTNVQ
jgi:hypothetical protein